jgi:hypothetical protein
MHEILHRFAHPLVFTFMGLFPLLGIVALLAAHPGEVWEPLGAAAVAGARASHAHDAYNLPGIRP